MNEWESTHFTKMNFSGKDPPPMSSQKFFQMDHFLQNILFGLRRQNLCFKTKLNTQNQLSKWKILVTVTTSKLQLGFIALFFS